eukprot:518013_1
MINKKRHKHKRTNVNKEHDSLLRASLGNESTSINMTTVTKQSSYTELTNNAYDENKSNENCEGWPIFEPMSGPYPLSVYLNDYKQLKNEILSGVVVSFAQVPEAVAFALLAGVDPFIGLHAAWIVGLITSLFGGRCAEISGATGATAAVLAPYMTDPNIGVMYLPYIIGIVGVIVIFSGFIGVSKVISLIPRSCMIGFVNGLAIIIASSQLHAFTELNNKHAHKNSIFYQELSWMIGMAIITFIIVEYLPRFTKFVPATLIGILFGVFTEHIIIRTWLKQETVLIGELGEFAAGLPKIPGIDPYWKLPAIHMDTFVKILVPSLTVALVTTVEDLLTIEVVHDLTNTRPQSVEKCELITKLQILAMGVSNLICGFCGALGGGSTIGLSTVNCYSANGRYRWSGVSCAVSTFVIVFIASPALVLVPASALVGVMLVVVVHTFEWCSIPIMIVTFLPLNVRDWLNNNIFRGKYKVHPKISRVDGINILLVTIVTYFFNLGYAIIAGVLFVALMSSVEVGKSLKSKTITIKRRTTKDIDENEIVKIYTLEGPLLFSNANKLASIFNWNGDPSIIEVHLQNCIVYDYTALNALNDIAEKYKKQQKQIHLKHINVHAMKSFDNTYLLKKQSITFDMDVEVDDTQEFSAVSRLNVAQKSRHQI